MIEKKKASTAKAAAILFFVGGFFIPIAIVFCLFLITLPFVGMNDQGLPVNPNIVLPYQVGLAVASIIAAYIGIWLTARYVRDRYTIPDTHRALRYATGALIVVGVLWPLVEVAFGEIALDSDFAWSMVMLLVQVLVFYFVGKRYLA